MTRRGKLDARARPPRVRRRVAVRREGALPGCDRARPGAARRAGVGAAGRRHRSAPPPRRPRRALRGGRRLGDARGEAELARAAALAQRCWSRLPRLGEREDRRSGGTAASTAAPTCSSACREAATSSSRDGARSRIRSGSPDARSSSTRAERSSSTRGSSRSPGSSPRAARTRRTDGGCCSAARPASTCTRCASTSEGESLRKVHWRSTARRGQLMVKELEDAPRDEIAVVLDAERGGRRRRELRRAGARGRLDPRTPCRPRPARRARRERERRRRACRSSSLEGDWLAALEALAAVEPGAHAARRRAAGARGRRRLARARAGRRHEPPDAGARPEARCSARSGEPRGLARLDRLGELRGPADAVEPELLRLQAVGVPVAVVRRGDDLRAVLAAPRSCEAAVRASVERMRRTVVVYSLPAAIVALGLVAPRGARAGGGDGLWIVLLALAPALLPSLAAPARRRLRGLRSSRCGSPSARPTRPAAAPGLLRAGLRRASTTASPAFTTFACRSRRSSRRRCTASLLLAIFGFCLALGLASPRAGRCRPCSLLLAGAGWPATLLPTEGIVFGRRSSSRRSGSSAASGGAGRRPRSRRALVVVVGGVGLATLVRGRQGRRARLGALGSLRAAGAPVGVDYVWDANYGGIDFPEEATTCCASGAPRSLYWRATTLDRFTADRWIESLAPIGPTGRTARLRATRSSGRRVRGGELDEAGGRDRRRSRDDHLVAATAPVAYEADALGRVDVLGEGIVRRQGSSGAASATRSSATRPAEAGRARRARAPTIRTSSAAISTRAAPGCRAFGIARPRRGRRRSSTDERQNALWRLRGALPAGGAARRRARRRRTAPSSRSRRGCGRREASPTTSSRRRRRRRAAARAFRRRAGKRGYCQQFAGAMALMLRFLGIPARVAAGFTSGKYRDGRLDGHRPQRARLGRGLVPALGLGLVRPDARARRARRGLQRLVADLQPGRRGRDRVRRRRGARRPGSGRRRRARPLDALRERQAQRGASSRHRRGSARSGSCSALAGRGAAAAIGLGKLAWRRSRYLTSDPRELAGAARRELADFLVDQGIAVGASATPEPSSTARAVGARRRRPALLGGSRRGALRAARRRARRRRRALAASCASCCGGSARASAARSACAASSPCARSRAVTLPAVVIAAGLGSGSGR